jgi:hypothetical protein
MSGSGAGATAAGATGAGATGAGATGAGATAAGATNFMNSIQGKADQLSRSVSQMVSSITCPVGSECYITQQTTLLNNNLNDARTSLQNAPLELSLAEKNVYVYNGGQPGGDNKYNIAIVDRFATTAQDLRQNSLDKQQEYMADLAQALRQYQAQVPLLERTRELLQTRQKENADLTKKVDLYKKILHTNERKVVYENKDATGMYTYRRAMLFLYYAAIVCYIIFGNFIPDRLYAKPSVWLIIVLVSIIPIILNMVIRWIFIIGDVTAYWFKNEMPHRDIYATLSDDTSYSIN